MEKNLLVYFENALNQSKELFNDRERLAETLDRAFKKVVNIEDENSSLGRLVNKVKLFIMMVRDYIQGEYTEIPWRSILIITASLLYFLNPFDLVPDFIPGVGYLDDITVILWVFKSMEEEVLKYQEYLYISGNR